ncbi:MAG TPA: urate oxidase [Mycobacteriales bacterium]|nr:urate oxidase [Mycobacteriales bacterium]
MAIVLGDNRYGKAETRLVYVDRGEAGSPDGEAGTAGGAHRLTDLSVSTTLAGDLAGTHLTGDNTGVLPTDSQKNTVFAFARDGIGEIEDFALRLARHFVDSQPAIRWARVCIEQYGWGRVAVAGRPQPYSFVRETGTRTTTVTYDGGWPYVVSGVADLVVLNTTGSRFTGFARDAYTTLAETGDRILATALAARWRHAEPASDDWAGAHRETVRHLLAGFAETNSRSLQQTLYAMGERVLAHRAELAEIRLSLPNRHHILVDLTPFGRDNPGMVFYAADRPYGLIEGTVLRDDAPPAGPAW